MTKMFKRYCTRLLKPQQARSPFAPFGHPLRTLGTLLCAGLMVEGNLGSAMAAPPRSINETIECEVLVTGGGLAGVATAYESLLAGRTVCLTDLTDWMGGQLSSQGTSALDEAKKQRSLLFYPRGYMELRDRIQKHYKTLNPGDCWVSVSCFLPKDAHAILSDQLKSAAKKGKGTLKWFPSTVVKQLERSPDGRLINSAIAIQHRPAPGAPPLNQEPLSQVIEDAYRYEDSARFQKNILRFVPKPAAKAAPEAAAGPTPWFVIDATETGELIAMADIPYRLGIDPLSYRNPSSPSQSGDPYCTQGFTYTFAMEQTAEPQPQPEPSYYKQYAPYYSYEKKRDNLFEFVFTYRRIWSPKADKRDRFKPFNVAVPAPGDISMQNWTWGNDYRPGTRQDNLVYTREQLNTTGQLAEHGWLGGLRTDTLRKGEENAYGYYHWLVAGTTDSQLGDGVKQPHPNHRFIKGLEAPMGTAHGLSKFPYIREARRIIGRPAYANPEGFTINEIDLSGADFSDPYYQENLPPRMYSALRRALSGLQIFDVIENNTAPSDIPIRSRAKIFPDSVGIAQYAIDFHPCMMQSPPEKPGNKEREGIRRAHGQAYPAQIPFRAMIPQNIDNLLIAGKSIATSNIAAAAYRVHSFEWSAGAAAGTAVDLALDSGTLPYQMVDQLPSSEPQLEELQKRLQANQNPTAFPDTSIFNTDWKDWKVW